MPINHRVVLALADGRLDPHYHTDTRYPAILSTEHDGCKLDIPHQTTGFYYQMDIMAAATVAKRMAAAGFPDGDVHFARVSRPSILKDPADQKVIPGESWQDYHARLDKAEWVPQPERLAYGGSFGSLAKLAKYADAPRLNHNSGHQVGDKWVFPRYETVKELEKWVRWGDDMSFDFVHGWHHGGYVWDRVTGQNVEVPSGHAIATGQLPKEQWGLVERPGHRKTRYYYVDLQTPAAEFEFLLRWRATSEDISRMVQWTKWGKDG